MKGVVILGDEKVEVREVPKPQLKPGWVLVKIKASGICGSDLHFYHTPSDALSLYGKVVGHEPSGVVEEIGEGVTAVEPGDRVSVYHYLGCGHCHYCRSGYRQFCPEHVGIAASGNGSCAEYISAPEANCLPLPDELSFVDGSFMACTGGTAFSGLTKLAASGSDDLVVFGLGPVGLSAVMEAKAFGARVIGVEVVPERIELARTLGADEVIDAAATDPVAAVHELTRGRGASIGFEASGSNTGREQIVHSLAPHGKAVFVGAGGHEKVIRPPDLIHAERTLAGSYVLPMGLYRPLAKFLIDRDVCLERMVTHRFPIDEAVEAFRVFDTRKTGKVVLEFD